MDFYTYTTRRIGKYVLSLYLENGVTAQGITKEEALEKLNDALTSLKEAIADNPEIGTSPISINELHEFITAGNESLTEVLELHAVNAQKNPLPEATTTDQTTAPIRRAVVTAYGQVCFSFKEKSFRKNMGNGFPRVPLANRSFPRGQRAVPT